MYAPGHWGGTEVAETMLAPVNWNNKEPCQLSYIYVLIGGAAHTARWGSCPSYSAARNPPPLSSLRSETGAVPRLGGGCTQAACFFSISSAAGSTSTASCCFPLRVLVGFCKSSALTASSACVCGILQVRSTVNCSRHHHAR